MGMLSHFSRFLTYKARLAGKKGIEIDEEGMMWTDYAQFARNLGKNCYSKRADCAPT